MAEDSSIATTKTSKATDDSALTARDNFEAYASASDAYFALDRVLDVNIEIADRDWDALRYQNQTAEDIHSEIEEHQLSRPLHNVYTWFQATVTVDGETHDNVGVRKKGFIDFQNNTKPSFKIRFDKYIDDQSLGGVIERMTLNNNRQGLYVINSCMAHLVFAAAGHPAPRCNFATVTVNGEYLGLYSHVETIKTPFLSRHFEDTTGNLYEGALSDFTPKHRGTIEKETNEDADDWSDIDAVASALQDPSEAGLKALGEIVDLERFLTFLATEMLVGHWEGYTGRFNNYYFYREPDGPFVFIPWGVDSTFRLNPDPDNFNPPPSAVAEAAIANRLYNHPEWQIKYANRLQEILDTTWDEEALLDAANKMIAIMQEHALPSVKQTATANAEQVIQFIRTRRNTILTDPAPYSLDRAEPEAS